MSLARDIPSYFPTSPGLVERWWRESVALPACVTGGRLRARQVETDRTCDGPGLCGPLTPHLRYSRGPARRTRLQSHRDSRAESTVRAALVISQTSSTIISDNSHSLRSSRVQLVTGIKYSRRQSQRGDH